MWEMCVGIVTEGFKVREKRELLRKRQREGRDGKEEREERNEEEKEGREPRIGTERDAGNQELSVGLTWNVVLSLMMRKLCWLIREHD
jgi:hypothetical protein